MTTKSIKEPITIHQFFFLGGGFISEPSLAINGKESDSKVKWSQ